MGLLEEIHIIPQCFC